MNSVRYWGLSFRIMFQHVSSLWCSNSCRSRYRAHFYASLQMLCRWSIGNSNVLKYFKWLNMCERCREYVWIILPGESSEKEKILRRLEAFSHNPITVVNLLTCWKWKLHGVFLYVSGYWSATQSWLSMFITGNKFNVLCLLVLFLCWPTLWKIVKFVIYVIFDYLLWLIIQPYWVA